MVSTPSCIFEVRAVRPSRCAPIPAGEVAIQQDNPLSDGMSALREFRPASRTTGSGRSATAAAAADRPMSQTSVCSAISRASSTLIPR